MSIPAKTRAALKERAHDCCEMCGKYLANNAHHRKNRSQGGGDNLANLMLLCGSGTTGCHGLVTTEPLMSKRMGWTVRWISDPAEVPVWRYDRARGERVLVLLDDEGGWSEVEDAA